MVLKLCPLNKSDNNSFDVIMNQFFMKLFGTINRDIIAICRVYFNIQLPSAQIKTRTAKFFARYRLAENTFCRFFSWLYVDMFLIVMFATLLSSLLIWILTLQTAVVFSIRMLACGHAAGWLCDHSDDCTVVIFTAHCSLLLYIYLIMVNKVIYIW
jgi:hypothetical protein